MKRKYVVIGSLAVLIVVLCVSRDFIIKSMVQTVSTMVTGAPVRLGKLSLSVLRQSVEISDLRMYDPEGFERNILLEIPNVRVSLALGDMFSGKLHIKQLDLELKEIGLTKNKEAKMNVDSLKVSTEKMPQDKGKKTDRQMALRIDLFNLSMGQVVSRDYSVGDKPVIKVYNINLKKSYKDINSAQQLAALIISEPLKAAGIHGLKIYGASMLTGVAALPVAAAFVFAGKDHAQETFGFDMNKVYDAALEAVRSAGKVSKEDKAAGVLKAQVNGYGVTVRLTKLSQDSIRVTVSARKMALPKPEIAAGVIYRMSEILKRR